MESIYVLLGFGAGWLIAQLTKIILCEIEAKGKLKLQDAARILTKSGGMPSGHTASFTAATLMIGFVSGFDSAIFALAVCTTMIIIYDAINVRYAVGMHGEVINKLMLKSEVDLKGRKTLKVVEGHTLPQAIVGFLIGITVSVILAMIFGLIK